MNNIMMNLITTILFLSDSFTVFPPSLISQRGGDNCQQVRWAIGDGRLNISPEGLMITPPFHQRHLLWPPFSLRKVVLSRERLPP
jgi:hypothetical protein